ncbi:DoxX family protein [Sediminibacterium soli]|uniref:DoxX family protein n=1 Tax=Sediminibacterium soli TaxID=2698829 RepID=UPI00137AA18D|nr:DoxX family protein [Sediminibacterium soli]NCI45225.1 DoxX family protein [Sediminibacterium soli]
MKKILSSYSWGNDGAILLIRLILGGMMMYHGYGKIVNYHTILPQFTDIIGIGARLSFHLVIFAEFFCSFLVLIGFLTRFAAVPILITMFVAYFVALKDAEFSVKELPFVFLLLSLVVIVTGGGRYSVDRLVFKN